LSGDKNPVPKEIAKGMQEIPKYAGVLGLFKFKNSVDLKTVQEKAKEDSILAR